MFSTSQFVRFERLLTDWHLTEITTAPNGINGEQVQVSALNRLGIAWAKHLPPLTNDKRTLPPLMLLADILADLPQSVFDWISGPPPIQKHAGGIMFEALGVLIPNHRGDAYNPSLELTLALDELAFRKTGRAVRQDGPASPFLDDAVAAALRRILDRNGVAWGDGIDGRIIRGISDKDGAGLVSMRAIPGREVFSVKDEQWFVPHMMQPVARALVDGELDPFKLITLMPNAYREWVADGLPINMVPPHPRLLALIGVIKKKGKYDWQFVRGYDDFRLRMAAFLRAYENGATVPDDAPYDGSGVEIVLPDDPEPDFDLGLDNPFDILSGMTGAPADPTARARAAEEGHVIEAPVPSNAELARARAEREARQPVADLSLDDEFDIL
ncbi:hypothetical protein DELTA_119 [Brevundimonas phage vB_BsubS-Delta]|nr:hypothetical protein DELTA_119 [Brevundimonas phage vB_BsubS-Delta]